MNTTSDFISIPIICHFVQLPVAERNMLLALVIILVIMVLLSIKQRLVRVPKNHYALIQRPLTMDTPGQGRVLGHGWHWLKHDEVLDARHGVSFVKPDFLFTGYGTVAGGYLLEVLSQVPEGQSMDKVLPFAYFEIRETVARTEHLIKERRIKLPNISGGYLSNDFAKECGGDRLEIFAIGFTRAEEGHRATMTNEPDNVKEPVTPRRRKRRSLVAGSRHSKERK